MVGWLVNNGLEGTWKEDVVLKLRHFSGIYLKVLRKTMKNLGQNKQYPAEIRTEYLLMESLSCCPYTILPIELYDLCSLTVTYVGNQTE
jgi:hypothetical protein